MSDCVDIKYILKSMLDVLYNIRPPRFTALREIQNVTKGNSFNILICTVLSARSRDEKTAEITKKLLSKYKTINELKNANIKHIEKIIKPIGFYHTKARRIKKLADIIYSQYDGIVPNELDKLIKLPGVGRKTANCVLVYAFNKSAIPVDIHVHRISNRLGIITTNNPEETEFKLMKKINSKYWNKINDVFVMYGQNICTYGIPLCEVCKLTRICKYYKSRTMFCD